MQSSNVEVMPRGRGQLSRVESVLRRLDPRRSYVVRWEAGADVFEFSGTFRAVNAVMWGVLATGADNVEGFRPGRVEDTFLFPVATMVWWSE